MGVDCMTEELKADLLLYKISSKIVCDPIEARKFSDPIFACVTMQVMDEKFGCAVARIVLPRLVMHTRYHYGLAFPKGLNSAPGRPRVAPSSPVIFEVTLEYVPGLDNE
ncbi:hypothetical protein ZIOFF_045372 [Zingiber officinale]|uniref:Uncharacterized protein n=1 Tax=Zingiber officinale TaxID=94328 RepID=A0A8J5KY74_ZINOF|nr:hypothetical protein ZIOFF_045372 [Zingiber officinale]